MEALVQSAEERLLLALCRLELGVATETVLRLLDEVARWDRLLAAAQWHEVAGLVDRHLRELDGDSRAVESLQGAVAGIAGEQHVRFRFFVRPALQEILDALAERQIEIIPLKGAWLVDAVYGDDHLRPVGDLDLLGREDQLSAIVETLQHLGYRWEPPQWNRARNRFDYHFCPRLLSPDAAVEVELHRHIVRGGTPLHFPVDKLWRDSVPGVVAGYPARLLSTNDLVLHLCLTFFLDRRRLAKSYGALRQLVDLSETLRQLADQIDWSRFVIDWRGTPLQGPIYCVLRSVEALLQAPVDSQAMQMLRPGDFAEPRWRAFVRRRILDREEWFFHQLVEPEDMRLANIVKAALHRMVPTRHYVAEKYEVEDRSASLRDYLHHGGDLLATLGRGVVAPAELRDDMAVELWMNRLQLPRD